MPKISFSMKISEKDSARINALLRGIKDAAPKVLLNGMNKTLGEVRTHLTTEIKSILTVNSAVIDEAVSVNEATPQRLSGSVVVTGKALQLIEFFNRQTPTGIAIQVKRGRPHIIIPGSFYAKTRTGRIGIFKRKWSDAAVKPRRNIKYGRLPNVYRLPIRELFSSSVPNVAGDVMPEAIANADERLQANLKDELDALLLKL